MAAVTGLVNTTSPYIRAQQVVFCILTITNPALIVLDEPTNHLDMETTDVLIEALREFKGAVMMVSHDQYVISSSTHTSCQLIMMVSHDKVYKQQHQR